jgi:hypothetical protein
MNHFYFPFSFLFLSSLPALQSSMLTVKIQKEGLENSHVMEHLDVLTNEIGPRLTGSRNFYRACKWAKNRFESFGLDARLEKWAEWPRGWDRGQWQGRLSSPEKMELQIATPAWTAGTKGRLVGELALLPRSKSRLMKERKRLQGKILFGPTPSRRSAYGRQFLDLISEIGAKAILTPSKGDKSFPNRIRVFGSYRTVFSKKARIPKVPLIVVRADQGKKIEAWLKAKKKVEGEFEIRNRWRKGPIRIHNVIAEIKGVEKPEEVVIVCGHLDSWHQATGTTDNGTGAATTIEAARILAKVGAKPKRTIRFILWGGEEQGLLGSIAYVRRHRQEMKLVSCVLNHDTGTNWAHRLSVSEKQFPLMKKVLAPVMKLTSPDKGMKGPVFILKKVKSLGRGGGSDHASFLRAGVPAFPWGLTGKSNYFGRTWHSQWDTYDAAIPAYQKHTATVIALTALGVANLKTLLPRK